MDDNNNTHQNGTIEPNHHIAKKLKLTHRLDLSYI